MQTRRSRTSFGRRIVAVASAAVIAAGTLALGTPAAVAQASGVHTHDSAAQTTRDYVIRYWPRTLSYAQQSSQSFAFGTNQLVGAEPLDHNFRIVVAINDDTVYCSTFALDVSRGPVILTVPATPTIYSVLSLNVFGDAFESGVPAGAPGTYALVQKGWQGTLPAGTTRVEIPYPVSIWTFRADKYSPTGQNMIQAANTFRNTMRLAPLADYLADPGSGQTIVRPSFPSWAFSFKVAEDLSAQYAPRLFLRATQRAVHDPTTQPLYPSDLALSAKFDALYAAAQNDRRLMRTIERAVGDAYREIVARWKDHVDANNWIHFDNIAAWGTAYLDRAAGTEFIQLGNNRAAAAYWNAWKTGNGQELNGARHDYKLTFPANNIPDAKRFWSVTMYTPNTVELVRNPANKYLVARYTPGLQYNADGSVTIYMSVRKPANVPAANWLPARRGPFTVFLRAYGPEGNTAVGTDYHPPAITIAR